MKTIELNEIKGYFNSPLDYFICSASFEERCLSIANYLDFSIIKNTYLCVNEDQIDTFKGHDGKLFDILNKADHCEKLLLDSEKAIRTVQTLIKALDSITDISKKTFAIDITTFTHEALLILFRLITSKGIQNKNVFYLYNNAACYSYNEKEIEKKWLSVGNKEIRSIFGYSGFMSPLKRNVLIVLVGFEIERTIKLIETYEPSIVSFGVGNDHCTDDSSSIKLNRFKYKQLQDEYINSSYFEFPVTCPYGAYDALSKEVAKYSGFNIIIAPMNNKISSFGVGEFALANPEVQLCYVPAKYYNVDGYSKPGSKCFIFQRRP